MPVTDDGQIAHGWGRAPTVAVAVTTDAIVVDWQIHDVGWDAAHDTGSEGSHHARIARFLTEQHVDAVVVDHMGPGMVRMLTTMGIRLATGAHGDARTAVAAASRRPG